MTDTLPPNHSIEARALPRRRQIIIVVVAAWIILGVVGAVAFVRDLFKDHLQETAAPEPGIFYPTNDQMAGFKTWPVSLMAFHTIQVTDGKIATNDDTTTPVFSPYSGRVTRLIAKAGDVVQQGRPLLAIEASEFVQGQNDVITTAATARTAEAQLKLSRTNEKRQHDLFEAKGGTLKDWQQSQVDLANAEGGFRTAEIALAAARNRLRILGRSEKEITAVESAPDTAKMNPEALVPAPIGGTVIQRQVSVGQYINSQASGASTPIFSIGNLSTLWLVANVREADAAQVHVGDPVEVRVLALPDFVFKARLTYVGAVVDGATRRVTVRAELENPNGALKPEMFANFRIVTSGETMAPGVPEKAVVYEGATAHVWVVRNDGVVALRPIHAGRTVDGMVEVLDGLKPGEKVVTTGTLFIDRAGEGA